MAESDPAFFGDDPSGWGGGETVFMAQPETSTNESLIEANDHTIQEEEI